MIAIVGEGLRKRPPFTAVDKFLRSNLRRAGINERKCEFLAPGDSVSASLYVLSLGDSGVRALSGGEDFSEAVGHLIAHPLFVDLLVYCTYHPAYVMRRKSLLPRFRDDLETFAALVRIDSGVESMGSGTSP